MEIAELNKLYSDAESIDSDLFAEQRSNILLVSGDHYTKKNSRFLNRLRDSKELSQEQRVRLTKNHIQKISKTYINNILAHAPTAKCFAKNEDEAQDQKAAELHNAVLEDIKRTHKLKSKAREWCTDFFNIGEVAVEVIYDYSVGSFRGFKTDLDPETGLPVESKDPIFSGDLVFKRIFGFDLLRAPEAKSMADSPYLIVREMMSTKVLKDLEGDLRLVLMLSEKAGEWPRPETEALRTDG